MSTDIVSIKSNPSASTEDVLLKAAQTAKRVGASHFKLITAAEVGKPADATGTGTAPSNNRATLLGSRRSLELDLGKTPTFGYCDFRRAKKTPGGYFAADEHSI